MSCRHRSGYQRPAQHPAQRPAQRPAGPDTSGRCRCGLSEREARARPRTPFSLFSPVRISLLRFCLFPRFPVCPVIVYITTTAATVASRDALHLQTCWRFAPPIGLIQSKPLLASTGSRSVNLSLIASVKDRPQVTCLITEVPQVGKTWKFPRWVS